MDERQRQRRTENIANRRLFRRTIILMVIFGILAFIPLLGKLWNLQITRHDELEEMAIEQQTSTLSVAASRGSIYDTNGNVLAISSTVYDVIISPKAIVDAQSSLDQQKEDALKSGKNAAAYDKDVKALVISGMAEILGLSESSLEEKCSDTNSQYKRLASKVEPDVSDAVRAYIDENGLTGCIYLQPTTKRYYPYSTLASQIIGFTNDNGGAYGLEASFDQDLSGKEGLVVTAQNARGTDLLNFFQDYYDAKDGSDLHLTIDANIQTMCESVLKAAVDRYYVQDGGFVIAMRCTDGAVLGMASSPSYDLNNYATVTDSNLLEKIETDAQEILKQDEEKAQAWAERIADGEELEPYTPLTAEEARSQAYAKAINTMWRNKAINDTYEPGSTFKTLVLAATLEEGLTNLDDTFYCSGQVQVADAIIHCARSSGHGTQDLATAVGHSCNPAFIALGQRLGAERFYHYLEAFGIVTADGSPAATNIDLPGESASIVWPFDSFGPVELATASFGQRLQVTPIQLISAINTVIDGGYYYQPHVVDYVEDADGNITYSADTAPLRQVISESTSAICRDILEGAVANGLIGKNAYHEGYRIGGKTGTSEVLDPEDEGHRIVSFMGFAPANNPQVIVLLALDHPLSVGSTATYKGSMTTPGGDYISGGNLAAPVASDLIVDILDYLNYGKQYTADSMMGADVLVPSLVGMTLSDAEETCVEQGFAYTVEGQGDSESTVTAQTARAGSYIPEGSQLVLYIGDATPPAAVTVPDVVGMTPERVEEVLNEAGLYLRATGTPGNSEGIRAYSQSPAALDSARPGSVITVTFRDTSETEDESAGLD
ncbi:MAG: PASTA domain-containing protein [Oscillospiraceae bacterium]|nr:PASTA domain-containing protein [Oscillospiraceae bacterium]